jgi:hypothetical protein
VDDDQPTYFTKLNEKKKKKNNRAQVFAEGKRRNSLQSKRRGIGE